MITGYGREELLKVRFPILDVPLNEDVYKYVPILKSIPDWDYDFSLWADDWIPIRTRVARYIIFFYSQDLTCIEARYPDYDKRKAECARLAGFHADPVSKEFNPRIKEMLECRNVAINNMVISFLRFAYNTEYMTLRVALDEHSIMLRKRMNAAGTDSEINKKDLPSSKQIEESMTFISNLKSKLLKGDRHENINMALLQVAEEETLGWRPEERGERLANGESPMGAYDYYRRS